MKKGKSIKDNKQLEQRNIGSEGQVQRDRVRLSGQFKGGRASCARLRTWASISSVK